MVGMAIGMYIVNKMTSKYIDDNYKQFNLTKKP